MRIMKGRSSNPTYHVIQDVRRNGKRSTEIIENLGEVHPKYVKNTMFLMLMHGLMIM